MRVVHTSPNTFMHVTKFGLEGNIPSLICGDGTNYCTYGGSWSKSYIYSSVDCQAWNFSSFLGHLWCSCSSDLYFCLGEIGSLWSNLKDMDFALCFLFYYYYFLNNFVICWRSILPFIVVSSCLPYLFWRISLSSSSSNLDIEIVILVVLISNCFSFLG